MSDGSAKASVSRERAPDAGMKLSCSNPDIGSVRLGDKPITIGRHPENVLPLPGDKVASRFHCIIERGDSDGFVVKDLGARNGTHLNGEQVSTAPISSGDVLTIGTHTFTVEGKAPPKMLEVPEKHALEDARAAPKSKAPAVGAVDARAWARELRRLLDAIPPKDSPDPHIVLIDANRNESAAFEQTSDGPTAMRLVLLLASKARTTDVHAEPKGDELKVRMRIDGRMISLPPMPKQVGEVMLGFVKSACQMRQAHREAVLEGHFSVRFPDRQVDYRVSITPTMHGPKLVIRVLDGLIAPGSLGDLAMPVYMHDRLRAACAKQQGMVLSCGPTGSGKTTTLYNALRQIDRKRRNVVTIEDPVEYHIENVTQIPIGSQSTFADLLRSILRQDPDVILVGEIRDQETARTTMQAAMTGHLVFSTVHAKDTVGSLFRLLDLGVEPPLIANSMDLVMSQRLVRVLCEFCKRPVRITPSQSMRLGRLVEGKNELFAATGCQRCLRTGFYGRRAIFEMLDFNDELRDCLLNESTLSQMRGVINQGVFTSLTQSGWILAASGETSLDEVERVTGG